MIRGRVVSAIIIPGYFCGLRDSLGVRCTTNLRNEKYLLTVAGIKALLFPVGDFVVLIHHCLEKQSSVGRQASSFVAPEEVTARKMMRGFPCVISLVNSVTPNEKVNWSLIDAFVREFINDVFLCGRNTAIIVICSSRIGIGCGCYNRRC